MNRRSNAGLLIVCVLLGCGQDSSVGNKQPPQTDAQQLIPHRTVSMKINGTTIDDTVHIDALPDTKLEIQGTISGIDGQLEGVVTADPAIVVDSLPVVTQANGTVVPTTAADSGGLPIWIQRNGVKRSVQIVASITDTDRRIAVNAIPLRLERNDGNTIRFAGKLPVDEAIKNSEVLLLWIESDPTVAPGTASAATVVLKTIPLKISQNSGIRKAG